ncbi:Amidohydrolase family protein [Sulfidibacter corallicola]|uniref:Amidohydrolase family protein n=1 Tax=Sulfidibacter corallicola TaxID=2818388 RepID=A0A8A4TRH7_SULCO|nr:amidohydrolase family protein [Sulfidibacter corallicola]QTD49135.1 amidohydrolase family protein [Sulfidibacter corallicola]
MSFFALVGLLCFALPITDSGPSILVIRNVTLADPVLEQVVPHQTLIVQDRVIWAMGSASEIAIPDQATVVDGSGRYLIPGLSDMHVHLQSFNDTTLTLFAVNGVTLVRDMGGDPLQARAFKERIAEGRLIGPRIFAAGPIFEYRKWLKAVRSHFKTPLEFRIPVRDPHEVAEAFEIMGPLPMDLVKVRTIADADTMAAIGREAKRRQLALTGHVEGRFSIEESIEAGQTGFEHLPFLLFLDPEFTEAKWEKAIDGMVRANVFFDPTYVAMMDRMRTAEEMQANLDKGDPRSGLVSDSLRRKWQDQVAERRAEGGGGIDWKGTFDKVNRFVRRCHQRKVPFLTGTDLAVPMVFPGSSVYEEMQHLVDHAGFTPREALRASTLNGPRALGLEKTSGRIAVGQRADLVLLKSDPFTAVPSPDAIVGVVVAGRWLDREKRASLKAWVQANRNKTFDTSKADQVLERTYREAPTQDKALFLARYRFIQGDYAASIQYFKEAGARGADERLVALGRFNALLNGLDDPDFQCNCAMASRILERYIERRGNSHAMQFRGALRLSEQLLGAKACNGLLGQSLARLDTLKPAGEDATALDESLIQRHLALAMNFHISITGDIDKALAYRSMLMPKDWRDNAGLLNNTAWWLFQHRAGLDRAQKLAEAGVAASTSPREKANVLDTLAEIQHARGETDAALDTIRKAIDLHDSPYLRKQEARFAQAGE